jgi:hypothetical protein
MSGLPPRLLLIILAGSVLEGRCQDTLDLYPAHPGTLICWSSSRESPRPLKIFFLQIRLHTPGLEVFTLPGEDPDGKGPAESKLTLPTVLLEKYDAVAAVNANAFAAVPNDKSFGVGWYEGRPVDIHGLVASSRKIISPVESGRTSFWLDTLFRPHIGDPGGSDLVSEAVADWFSPLLKGGAVIPDPADMALHPRTALGFDDSGSRLLLVVVDGRQPGYSEGISLFELAGIFLEQGCTESINLDGGGSSIMLIRTPDGESRTFNRPSGRNHRPVPVMLGVRRIND